MTYLLKTSVVAFLSLWLLASPSQAQQKTPAKKGDKQKFEQGKFVEIKIPVAVLDVQAILRNAKAVKSIRKQITKFGSKFEEEIEKERAEIRKANQELARQRTILSPDIFAEKRRKFEKRVVEVQRLVQKRQRELDKSRNTAMGVVNKTYTEIVSKVANENNLAVIVRKAQTAYSVKALDITSEILTRLDEKLPTVKVSVPGK